MLEVNELFRLYAKINPMYQYLYLKPSTKDTHNSPKFSEFIKNTAKVCDKNAFLISIARVNNYIYFVLGVPKENVPSIKNILKSLFPSVGVETVSNYPPINQTGRVFSTKVLQSKDGLIPHKTINDSDIDYIDFIIELLQNTPNQDLFFAFELWVKKHSKGITEKVSFSTGVASVLRGKKEIAKLAKKKFEGGLYDVEIRVVSNDKEVLSVPDIKVYFDKFSLKNGNSYKLSNVAEIDYFKVKLSNLLSIDEFVSVIHFPKTHVLSRKLIVQDEKLLPIPKEVAEAAKREDSTVVGFGVKNDIKGDISFNEVLSQGVQSFDLDFVGIPPKDKNQHVYIIGKTGSGKTKLMELLMLDNVYKNENVIFLDPHGDTCEDMLRLIPHERMDDVIYIDFTRKDLIPSFNPLDQKNTRGRGSAVYVDGLVDSFRKFFGVDWNPRLEFLLKQIILALQYEKNATIDKIVKLLNDASYRNELTEKIGNDAVKTFWAVEFLSFSDKYGRESVSPLVSKINQMLSNQTVRRIVSVANSSFYVGDVIKDKKILLVNLSVGALGEWNSSFLGSMIVSKIMQEMFAQSEMPEEKRLQANLYVDEFQKFSTESFINIFSEARKYKLSLTVAHQYLGQIDENIMKSILGNVGSIFTFRLGQTDANVLSKEFKPYLNSLDFTYLHSRNFWAKVSVDGKISKPFLGRTLTVEYPEMDYAEYIRGNSYARYYRLASEVDEILKGNISMYKEDETNTFTSPI